MTTTLVLLLASTAVCGPEPSTPESEREVLRRDLALREQALDKAIAQSPKNLGLHSQRGDVRLFLGKFQEAAEDYDRMVQIDPATERSHWRRGIALYYSGDFERSAKQFEIYHSYDDVDRENGLWRYLAQSRAYGIDKARDGLLEYTKDDRPPLPDLYQMFAGQLTAEEIFRRIASAKVSEDERNKRLFYAHLYIGLDAANREEGRRAEHHLLEAVANPWGAAAQGGPGYMWQVARVHAEQLANSREE